MIVARWLECAALLDTGSVAEPREGLLMLERCLAWAWLTSEH